ncbi:MAG: signal recognition particle-docking protein FtsY [Myxococcota bacterium]
MSAEALVGGGIALLLAVLGACFAIGLPRAARRAREVLEAPPVEAVPAEPVAEAAPAPDLSSRLARTRRALVGRVEELLRGRAELDPATLDALESLLFGADLGVATADHLLEAARRAGSPERVRASLEARALELLLAARRPEEPAAGGRPRVVLVVGVNGSGKTTTIGKLAARWARAGQRVVVAAADTYRAAAIDQLEIWAERAGAELMRGEPGGDPAAVAFDAVRRASARNLDVVLIDTAGRLQTDSGLMDELAKISRVVGKELPGAPHEVLLVIDANVGQNGIRQAQEFSRTVPVSEIALTKLDGTAKGGVVLGIAEETGIPVRFVGVGEDLEDLIDFDPERFVRALFSPA